MSHALSNLSIETSSKPGTSRELVLGIASSGMNVVAVGVYDLESLTAE